MVFLNSSFNAINKLKMNNFLRRTKKRNNSLIKLRKEDMKLNVSKSKQNNPESFAGLYEEYLKNRKMKMAEGTISRKSIEILSSNNLNIFNEFNDNNNEEHEKINEMDINKNTKQNKSNNGSKINNQYVNIIKKEKQEKNNNIDNSNDDFDIEDSIKKTNLNIKENPLNKSKIVIKDKTKTLKKKKTKFNIKLNEIEDEDNSSEHIGEFSIKIYYEGKGLSIKMPKKEKFSKCLSAIQKILFPFYKLCDYDILYKLNVLNTKSLSDEILSNIIKDSNNSATFYLRKKIKKVIKNNKDTTVLIENFPSFTDLATELNKFFEKEKRESNFTVDYKGSVCKVSFSESEKAFSLIIYLTKLKKANPIYKRLKINMDYKLNVVIDTKKLKQKPIKLFLPLINKNSVKTISNSTDKKLLKINTEKNIYNNKSRNDNNNLNNNPIFNSIPQRSRRRYDSCLTLGDAEKFYADSRLNNNNLKNKDSFLDNFNNKKINSRNSEVYTLGPQEKTLKNNYNRNLSGDSAEMMSKLSKIKSTNFIIDLSKKKKKELKNFLNNKDESKNLSPEIRPKKLSYYNLFVKSLSSKYKDSYLAKDYKKDNYSVED